jgi:N-methylhydantoinase A
MRIAIDTGGTFTDCVYMKEGTLAVLKVLSTPDDPAQSVLGAIRQIAAPEQAGLEVRHGTTIGTNALLERKGARVAFVTTAGFEDTIAIGRQARQHLYDWMATPAPCLVPAELRFGVRERVSAEGEILRSPSSEELADLREQILASGAECIAVCLLFSFANSENERRVMAALRNVGAAAPVRPVERSSAAGSEASLRTTNQRAGRHVGSQVFNLPISVSHEILPEFREYERAATVVVNAYLAPKVGGYVQRIESAIRDEHGGSLHVMQSSGGIISAKLAAEEPVRTVLSGPAGGVIGAHRVAQIAGFENIIAFDMGGTSTDVSLIDATGPKATSEASVSEIPVSVPMLDIHTVGAGGGSLAWFDRGGILHVGPASAGADPGPICYGRGEQPTVSDANLVLGRLDPTVTLAATVRLNEQRTRHFMESSRGSIHSIEQFATGIVQLAEVEMEKAIRLISVERGHDPRDFTLVCFGGAGPLHACSLARALGIPRVLVPAMPGALSALGILISDVVRDYSRTVMLPPQPEILEPYFVELETRGAVEFRNQGLIGVSIRSADLRYAGQGYELNVVADTSLLASFHTAHRQRYGHADEGRKVEVANVRVRMVAASEKFKLPRKPAVGAACEHAFIKKKPVMFDNEWLDADIFQRDLLSPGNRFEGPAIVHEYSATTVVPPGCRAAVDTFSNLLIEA